MDNGIMIAILGLTKRFGERQVLHVDSLAIAPGRIMGIIGPSGSGKSTLLRILTLLESPTTGEILYDGRPAPQQQTEQLALRRKMTMVFQKPVLLNRSVFDNIAFGLRARGLTNAEIRERVEPILQEIGLAELSRQNARTLSGGEAQRVAFARALVLRPEILCLDEPTANLDPANVELLEGMVRTLNHDCGTTILVVTHNLFQAKRLAHNVAFLYQGVLIEAGETAQIFRSPAREETRSFVEGKMIY